jgi:hypothetical protein
MRARKPQGQAGVGAQGRVLRVEKSVWYEHEKRNEVGRPSFGSPMHMQRAALAVNGQAGNYFRDIMTALSIKKTTLSI